MVTATSRPEAVMYAIFDGLPRIRAITSIRSASPSAARASIWQEMMIRSAAAISASVSTPSDGGAINGD